MSPSFDPEIMTNGLQEKALNVITSWLKEQNIQGCSWEVLRQPERTPLLIVDVTASDAKINTSTLMYGHFDKQPPFDGWLPGLGPYMPVVKDGKLYARGAADDGYALFASILAVASLQKEKRPHPRIVILIEGSEESGSRDLPFYMTQVKEKIGEPNLIVCLDSGAGNYDQLWVTSSLRGIVVGDLKVSVLTEGVHSGDASGVVPSSFRIARALLSRLEDESSGDILPPALYAKDFLGTRRDAAREAGKSLGRAGMIDCFPFIGATQPVSDDNALLAENRWWKPQLEVIGATGLPPSQTAGNVLRPSTTLTLSLRLPPTVDKSEAEDCLRKVFLEKPAPHSAQVDFNIWKSSQGWSAPMVAPWLEKVLQESSKRNFSGRSAVYQGEGGSIPFMAMLGNMLPKAQFFVCGVLGPGSNAHGPNEFLHLDYCQRIIACVAEVLTESTYTDAEEGDKQKKQKMMPDELVAEFGRNADGSKV
jgi:acetylornithine deacetylase/succinyl-diaminopimelate desuccinylase-like protein